MYEIEAKASITYKEFISLRKFLTKKTRQKSKNLKLDTYYGYIKKEQIRIRKQKANTIFNLKLKSFQKNAEENIELEWLIKNEKAFKGILKKIKVEPAFIKIKKTESFFWKGFSIELNHVKGLGYFLEIEKCVNEKLKTKETHNNLLEIFKLLGFNRTDLEKKPYLQMLQEK